MWYSNALRRESHEGFKMASSKSENDGRMDAIIYTHFI